MEHIDFLEPRWDDPPYDHLRHTWEAEIVPDHYDVDVPDLPDAPEAPDLPELPWRDEPSKLDRP